MVGSREEEHFYNRLDDGLSGGEERRGERLHSLLPPEPKKCVIQERPGLLCKCKDMMNGGKSTEKDRKLDRKKIKILFYQ